MIPIPNLPDHSYKITMLIGIVVIIASYFLVAEHDSKGEILNNQRNVLIDSFNIQQLETDFIKQELFDVDTFLTKKYTTRTLITKNDSMLFFERLIKGDSVQLLINDSIKKHWNLWNAANNKMKVTNKRIELINSDIERHNKSSSFNLSIFLLISGALSFFLGIYAMERKEKENSELSIRQNASLPRVFSKCQSCSIAFSSVISYSTNADDSINYSFCAECYQHGVFVEPQISLDEMKQKVEVKVSHLSKRRQKRIIKSLEDIERWKKDKY